MLTRLLILSLVLAVGVIAQFSEGGRVNVQLLAKEWKIPFHLQFLESVAAVDESLYAKAVYALTLGDIDDEFLGDEENDHLVYQTVKNAIGLTEIDQALVDLKAASKFFTPRIQTQYLHYTNFTVPEHMNKVNKQCEYDSFGSKIVRQESIFPWLLAKDRLYCSPDDLFALQLTKKSDLLDNLQPFDRIIGSNERAPLLVLYGDLQDQVFKQMFNNLYQSAEVGKLRFVWRYVPVNGIAERLPNYGALLSMKDGLYLSQLVGDKRSISLENAKLLGLKLASHILTSNSKPKDKFQLLKDTLNNIPNEIDGLSRIGVNRIVKESAEANENMGISEEINGIYLNGAPVNDLELDTFKLINSIEKELAIITEIMELGFNLDQARTLITKFALYTSVKLNNFDDGSDDQNRYKIYEHEYVSRSQIQRGGVVYVNNIETDDNYEDFSSDRFRTYLNPEYQANPNKLPPLKENIHDLVFAINLSDKKQLKILFTMSKLILDNAIPQQIGILPIVDSQLDEVITNYFYFITETSSTKEAMAFLYKVFMRESDNEANEIFDLIPIQDYKFDNLITKQTLEKFSITEPSVIVNGKIFDVKTEWRDKMAQQLVKDIQTLQKAVSMGDVGLSMKSYLYKNAKSERNLEIVPLHSSQLKYKKVTSALIKKSIEFSYESDNNDDIEMFIVGDMGSSHTIKQLINIFELMKISSYNIQVRVLDTTLSDVLKKLILGVLNKDNINKNIAILKAQSPISSKLNIEIQQFLATQMLPSHHSFLLINSRYLRLDKPINVKDLDTIISFEQGIRLSIVDTIMLRYSEIFNGQLLEDFYDNDKEFSYHDWQDLFFSRLTKSFHIDDVLYLTDVARYDFSSMNILNSFVIDNSGEELVDIFIVIDPLLPASQHIINIISSCINLPFVRTRVLLQPKQQYETLPVLRFYQGLYPEYPLNFDDQGFYKESRQAEFSNLPLNELLSLDLIIPTRWKIVSKYSKVHFDPDNINFSNYDGNEETIVYELSNILVEGYSKVVTTALLPEGLYFSAEKDITKEMISSPVMGNLGYIQLGTDYGSWKLSTDGVYDLLSASSNAFDSNRDILQSVNVNIYTLDGLVLKPRLVKLKLKNEASKQLEPKSADINIFTVVTGHLYEKLASMMMISIRNNTKSTVKFWILRDYLSPKFQQYLPILAKELDFQYELVSYKWPIWLRKQTLRQRTIWGYKILFLDALFPKELDEIIFVDADQINRSDMKELVDLDMEDAPYGFVPMCESRDDMKGYMFWKEGYWKSTLQDVYKYHISALFKVNLTSFRQLKAGDELRQQYQRLSAVAGSLSNLDQDLPNSFQRVLPIHSLPQEYLWCETWCSDDTKPAAKNIDLCNNPKSKENKVESAKRIIDEWSNLETKLEQIETQVNFIESDAALDLTQDLTDLEKPLEESEPDFESDWEHDEL